MPAHQRGEGDDRGNVGMVDSSDFTFLPPLEGNGQKRIAGRQDSATSGRANQSHQQMQTVPVQQLQRSNGSSNSSLDNPVKQVQVRNHAAWRCMCEYKVPKSRFTARRQLTFGPFPFPANGTHLQRWRRGGMLLGFRIPNNRLLMPARPFKRRSTRRGFHQWRT